MQLGLLERYCTANNKKNIVIKVSDAGKEFYSEYVESHQIDVWQEMFKELDKLDEASVQSMVRILSLLRKSMLQTVEIKAVAAPGKMELIKLD